MSAGTSERVRELRACAGQLSDLGRIYQLLLWDQGVVMPTAAAAARGEQLALLARHRHALLTGERLGAALEAARPEAEGIDRDLAIALADDRERARAVPSELVTESARATAHALKAWHAAREANDAAIALPHLAHRLELELAHAACFPQAEHPYDALMEKYTRGARLSEVRDVLGRLREGLVALLGELRAGGAALDAGAATQALPEPARAAFFEEVLMAAGLDGEGWRYDGTTTAFAAGVSIDDVRVVADYREPGLLPLYCALHELGHGLYEHGFDRALDRTTLDAAASLAVHESQARLLENFVGRSAAFWRWAFPRLATAFPDRFAERGWEDLYRATNAVAPSLVRVDADELTYGLHVDVRIELELALVEGRLAAADVPAAWSDLYRERIGVAVPDARHGMLQDEHWAIGMVGYFPNYSLGNVIAGQLWRRLHAELPQLDDQIARGDFAPLREWLRDTVHREGRRTPAPELTARIVGGALDPDAFLDYLGAKLRPLHGLA